MCITHVDLSSQGQSVPPCSCSFSKFSTQGTCTGRTHRCLDPISTKPPPCRACSQRHWRIRHQVLPERMPSLHAFCLCPKLLIMLHLSLRLVTGGQVFSVALCAANMRSSYDSPFLPGTCGTRVFFVLTRRSWHPILGVILQLQLLV